MPVNGDDVLTLRAPAQHAGAVELAYAAPQMHPRVKALAIVAAQ